MPNRFCRVAYQYHPMHSAFTVQQLGRGMSCFALFVVTAYSSWLQQGYVSSDQWGYLVAIRGLAVPILPSSGRLNLHSHAYDVRPGLNSLFLSMFMFLCFCAFYFVAVLVILSLLLVSMGGQHDGVPLSGSPPIIYIWYAHLHFFMSNKLCWSGCRLSCVLHTVADECDGRRRCSVDASTAMFGNRCLPGATKFLGILHTCGQYTCAHLHLMMTSLLH